MECRVKKRKHHKQKVAERYFKFSLLICLHSIGRTLSGACTVAQLVHVGIPLCMRLCACQQKHLWVLVIL